MRLKLVLPVVPSVNHCYRNVSIHRRILTTKGKEWQREAQWIAKRESARQGWIFAQKTKLVMEITTYWPDKRRRDTHNQVKLLADTLEGILFDDDRWLLVRDIDFSVDKGNPRVEVELYCLEEKEKGVG